MNYFHDVVEPLILITIFDVKSYHFEAGNFLLGEAKTSLGVRQEKMFLQEKTLPVRSLCPAFRAGR